MATVAALDKAAQILVAAVTTITGVLIAAGFALGDFTSFYRNHFGAGLAFLLLSVAAIIIGTFAFLIDAVESENKLRAEVAAVYVGVVAFGAAFVIAAVGLASGTSSGSDRPVLTTGVTTDKTAGTTTVTATASRSAVPHSSALAVALWGVENAQSPFVLLRYDVVGPKSDGTASDTADATVASNAYTQFVATAVVAAPPASAPTAPPNNCLAPASAAKGIQSDLSTACAMLKP